MLIDAFTYFNEKELEKKSSLFVMRNIITKI